MQPPFQKDADRSHPIENPDNRVPLNFFDPVGVQKLQRSLTGQQHDAVPDLDVQTPASNHGRTARPSSSMSTILGDQDFDFEMILKDIVRRCGEQGLKKRELGVMFKDLRVVGIGTQASSQSTMGSVFNPAALRRNINNLRHPPVRDILSGFDGVITPGEMLIVLGRPGSGCSTFLKTIANQRREYHAVYGDVYYDSFTPQDIETRYRGDVIYCPEDDVHFPTLSVSQTLSFAATTRTPQQRFTNQSRGDYNVLITEVLMRIFGLGHARNTVVGNEAIRGVSGGEKKRVSIAEALSCRSRIGAWDNSTRGLDASTALEFVRALRIATDIARTTTIVSIYQAGEQLYNLFDKVCVINEGKMVYFGPAKDARQYFIDMGYEPQNRQTTADFLVAVTDPNGRKFRQGFQNTVPRSADEMAAYFRVSRLGQLNRSSMDSYYTDYVNKPGLKKVYAMSAAGEHARHAPKNHSYTISIPMQVRAVMHRRWQILKGDWVTHTVQFGALFFNAISAMAEIPALFAQRPIVLRHQKAAMYYSFIESLAHTVVDIPITLVTELVFAAILYFLVDLQRTVAQFFIFVLIVFAVTIAMKAFFRTIAASCKDEASAVSLSGVSVLLVSLYTGYTIPRPSIVGGLRWLTYLNPLRYGFESLLVNEFHTLNGTCSTLVPQGPGYDNVTLANQVCTTVGSQPGQPTVDGNLFASLSYGYEYSNLWKNFGIICIFGAGFLVMLLTATEFNKSSTFDTTVTLFKQGARTAAVGADASSSVADDEEKGAATAMTSSALNSGKVTARSSIAENLALGKPATIDIFSWKHVQYVVPIAGGQQRKLLDDVSGYVAPGKLTALMGESGAGKTTLLNVLAQRVSTGVVLGDRLVNGQALPADFQAQTGYCQQMDTHIPESTVREALLFSARLRQPEAVPLAEKEAYVDKCLKMCGLEEYADAIVGSLGVEHRKRTTIGVELAAKPKLLLFLDEPTSGLDSQSAWAIMTFLRELADNGQAILCTIHQPSAELFQVFDRLLLLRKGGQTVYFGDIGDKSSTMLEYFERNGAPQCNPDANPAEYMLDVIGAGATASSSVDWHQVWKASAEASELQLEIERFHIQGRERPALESSSGKHSEFATSWMTQVVALTRRGFESYWRNPTYLLAKLVLNIAGGLLIGFTFFRTKDTSQGTQNKLFAIFMATVLCVPLAQQLQSMFISIRSVYEVRERPSRMYSWTALIPSLIIIELPWNILSSSIFFCCWYWTVGFETSRAGFTYLLYGIVFPFYYTTIGQAIAAMAPSAVIASLLFSTLFSFVVIFNGVLQPFSQLGWWRWMYRVSPFTYLIEALLGQAIGHQPITCSSTELVTLQPPVGMTCSGYMSPFIAHAGGYLTNPDATSSCQYCPFQTTDQFMMATFNIEYSHHWRNFGIMLGVCVFNVSVMFVLYNILAVDECLRSLR
ncbi:ABC-2 type transporter-domain-containing protein [Phlebopus sp. FC_14]|nr:ABC-2 type transporter-domain-containing protein [Phlebopus sp. FC_14]